MPRLAMCARRGWFGSLFATALALLAVVDPGRAEAQGAPGPIAGFDAGNGTAILDNSSGPPHPNSNVYVPFEPLPPGLGPLPPGYESGFALGFNLRIPVTPLNQQPGCVRPDPRVPNRVVCPPPPLLRGYRLVLGLPHRNWATVAPTVPKLPGPNVIKGGNKRDVIKGGRSNEKVNTGKGKDKIDGGEGRDQLDAGAGDDEIDSRDGKVDRVNGGRGKDAATVDKQDKVKNVEVVKRK